MQTIEQQLTELGFTFDVAWTRHDNSPLFAGWQCDCRDVTYSMSAISFVGVGIVSVSAHFPLRVPAAAAMSYLAEQLRTSHAAHALVCAAS